MHQGVLEEPVLQPSESDEPPLSGPEGGFRLIFLGHIVAVWFACREGIISLAAVRAYFALHEIAARRYAYACSERLAGRKPDFEPVFRIAELAKLMGLPVPKAKRALAELEGAGFVEVGEHSILFMPLQSLSWTDAQRLDFETFQKNFSNLRRRVPLPRRTLVLIAESSSRSLIWSMLAHCIRCCFYYSGQKEYRSTGTVKASWVARTGGFSLRAAKEARRTLAQWGWLRSLNAHQTVRNTRGELFEINPEFVQVSPDFDRLSSVDGAGELQSPSVPAEITVQAPDTPLPASPPTPPEPCVSFTPIIKQEPLLLDGEEAKNQDNDLDPSRVEKTAGPGFYISQFETPETQTSRPATESSFTSRPGREKTLPPPRLSNIRMEDFANIERLLELHRQAEACKLVNGSEHDRLMFVAAAEKCRLLGPEIRNPCGVFNRIVRGKLWSYIPDGATEAANERLKNYLFPPHPAEQGGGLAAGIGKSVPGAETGERPRLSKDALLLQVIRNRGVKLDAAFPALKGQGWDRARFSAAAKELEGS
jgi:hypothetical protein